ncbi:hypothetical protein B0H14DRAFT_3486802 [Mycena olivaceomarginata]|nr:hypothetical protein B0H14DRAFT_3486802 [Mycena olivaceomarginata]
MHKDHDILEAETASTVHARTAYAALGRLLRMKRGESRFRSRLLAAIPIPLHVSSTLRPPAQFSTPLEPQLSTKRTGSTLCSRLDFQHASTLRTVRRSLHLQPSSLAVVSQLDAWWTFNVVLRPTPLDSRRPFRI